MKKSACMKITNISYSEYESMRVYYM